MSDSRSGDSLVRQPADLEAPGGLFTQSYGHLDRGVVAGHGRVVRPCDKSYIDATAKALLDNLECVAYFYTLENVDEEIKPPYYDAALDLVTIMRECRRLIESPALFPSDNSRDQFMWFCLTASKVLKTFRRKFDSFQEEARSCLYKGPRIAYAVCVGDVWYKLRTPQVMPEKILPDWHPLKENGVKDWNKYLNNQRELEHLDESRILQRVPANGLKLVWNIKQLYGSARTRLGVEAITATRAVEKDYGELERATGEDHILDGMEMRQIWRTMRCTRSDVAKVDSTKTLTLNNLSLVLCVFEGEDIPYDTPVHYELEIRRTLQN